MKNKERRIDEDLLIEIFENLTGSDYYLNLLCIKYPDLFEIQEKFGNKHYIVKTK